MTPTFLLKSYKNLRVLEAINNNCVRARILPALVVDLPAIQLASGYVCIKLHTTMSLPAIACFGLIYWDVIIFTTAMFTASSRVYTKSGELLATWRAQWRSGSRSELRRSLSSLCPVKVRFGNNFVDHSTPLVFQDTINNLTVSCLLIAH